MSYCNFEDFEKQNTYYTKHRDLMIKRASNYYYENIEKQKENQKRYRSNNKEYFDNYRKNNQEKQRIYNLRFRQKKALTNEFLLLSNIEI